MAEITQKSYYAIIPANVRYDNQITPNAKLLYGEITALCNEKGYCWAGNSYFAELYSVSKTSISKWIKSLIDGGYIKSEISYKGGTKEIDKRYLTLVTYPIEEMLNTPIEEKLKDNNTVINNTMNKKKVSKSSFDAILTAYTNDEKTLELLGEWLKVRKAKRAAMTDRAIKLNIDKLDKLAKESNLSVNTYLDEIICRGWGSFFAINNYGKNNIGANGIAISNEDVNDLDGVL